MSFLSDGTIRRWLNNPDVSLEERIEITPSPKSTQIGQCSIDLTLSNQFARFRRFPFIFSRRAFDPRDKTVEELQSRWYKYYTVTEEEGFVVRPNEVVLAMSREYIKLPKTTLGLLTGRSSFSRMGIEIQLTQDLRQPGHSGQLAFQIKNNAPFSFRLYPGMRIAQLLIAKLDAVCETGYDEDSDSKYVGERGGIAAKWFEDPDIKYRQIISRTAYFKPFLDALLIAFGILSIAIGIQGGPGSLSNPFFVALLSTTVIIVFVRIYLYLRS